LRALGSSFALALVLGVGAQGSAQAQQQTLKVMVADFVDKGAKSPGTTLGIQATAAVYNELINSGAGRFYVFQTSEVTKEAQTLGIRTASVPGQPNNFSAPDLERIAKSLGADAVVEGEVAASPLERGRPVRVGLDVRIHDMVTDEDISGALNYVTETPRPGQVGDPEELLTKGVEDVALETIRQIAQRQLFVATILNVNGNYGIINIGTRNGLHVGDELTVYRLSPSGTVRVGRLKAARVYPGDAEADILRNVGGVQIEDQARIIYQPQYKLEIGGTVRSNPSRTNFSIGAVGATLTAIGIGVLVASASRGGQTSISGVTAEAGTNGNSPIVRVRWSDNVFGSSGVQQYKVFRLPDFPFGTVGGGQNNGGNGGNNNATAAGIPVGTESSTIKEFDDLPSPNFAYKSGLGFLVGNSNGGLNTGSNNNGNNGGGNQTQSCAVVTPANAATLDVGFTPGRSYRYQVTAVILRQSNLSSSGNQNGGGGGLGGGGGIGGGGGGNNGGSGNQGGVDCIETDPVQSGLSTPLLPVVLTSPPNLTGSIDIRSFAPTFASRTGADVFQLEISTDRTFKNPSRIFRQQIISTSPNADGATQSLPAALDLTTLAPLLSDTAFANFVGGSSTNSPTIYWRVGARHDEDVPGPINWISQNPSDPDKTFRFVYSEIFSFTAAPVPPPPPGRLAAILNKTFSGRAQSKLPLPGDTTIGRGIIQNHVLTPQEILTGAGRTRH